MNEIVPYQDHNLLNLIQSIEALKEELVNLTQEKIEIENEIISFNNQYNEKVGSTLVEFLDTKKENSPQEKKENVQKEIDDLKEQINISKKQKKQEIKLSKELETELKSLYKRACKLCHPDIVDDDFKQEAMNLFLKLNEANEKKDIQSVRDILDYLLDITKNKKENKNIRVLSESKNKIKSDIIETKLHILELKNDETYKTISSIEDWDRYFNIVTTRLQKEMSKTIFKNKESK